MRLAPGRRRTDHRRHRHHDLLAPSRRHLQLVRGCGRHLRVPSTYAATVPCPTRGHKWYQLKGHRGACELSENAISKGCDHRVRQSRSGSIATKCPVPRSPRTPLRTPSSLIPSPFYTLLCLWRAYGGGVRGHFVAMGPDRAMSVEYMTLPFFYTFGYGNTAFLGASTLAQWKLFQSPA